MLQLRVERMIERMSLFVLSQKSGIPQSTLSLAERGLVTLPEKDQINIAKVLGVAPERLFAEVKSKRLDEAGRVPAAV